jgi:hypothetical protein
VEVRGKQREFRSSGVQEFRRGVPVELQSKRPARNKFEILAAALCFCALELRPSELLNFCNS